MIRVALLLCVLCFHGAARAASPALLGAVDGAGTAVVVLDARSGEELVVSGSADREFPPGSVFKLVTALAAGAVQAEALGRPLRCPAPPAIAALVPCHDVAGHGALLLEEALAQSCNAYFAQLGEEVGTAQILRTAAEVGLGKGAGRLPGPFARAATLAAQGDGVLVTARQQARLIRAIAMGRLPSGQAVPGSAVLPRIRDGMRGAVQHGTARGAAGPMERVPIAGKTGTAVLGGSTIGWFGGFAPASEPSVVVVVGRKGATGREAARAARPIFEAYFHGR